MEIARASLAQLQRGRDGRKLLITEDVGDIAKRIAEIDPTLFVRFNEDGEFFQVFQRIEEGPLVKEQLVTTAQELTPALVEHVRMLGSEDYDLAKEADRIDREAEKNRDHRFSEKIGERGELLAHALRKDKQVKTHIIVPRGV